MYVAPSLVVGFHGCDASVFESVIKNGEALVNSQNDYDWLGHGVYFWEGSYDRAMEWAKKHKKVKQAAVVGAFIKLGNCIDLLDAKDIQQIKSTYEILAQECSELGEPLPENKYQVDGMSFVRELDCKVVLRLQQINNELIAQELGLSSMAGPNKRKIQKHAQFIDSIRGMFPEGQDLYPGAGFRDRNHIQLCVVNPNCIIGYFDPRSTNNWYKKV